MMGRAIIKFTENAASKLFPSHASKLCFTTSFSKFAHQDGGVDPDEADKEMDAIIQKSKEGMEEYNKDDEGSGYVIKEMAEEAVESMAVKAKEAADTAKAAKEKTKEKGKRMWEAAKDTTGKMKESVVGNSEVGNDGVVEDHVPEQKVYEDEDVVESRKKVGNLDHEKQNYSN